MATITAKTGSGVPLNVLDPNTWVGGIVPTGSDYAIFPNQTIRTQFRPLAADNYIPYTPWTGFKSIEVASTTGFDASGSFYCFPSPMQDVLLPIKIDYQSKSATTFISCSIDQSFRQWLYQNSHSYTETFPGDNPVAIGDLRYNDYLFKGYSGSLAATNQFTWQNQYILTGSGTWTVGRIDIGYGCDFTVKDTATLILDTVVQTTNTRITYTSNPQYGGMRVLDSATLHLTGSTNSAANAYLNGIYLATNANAYLIISGAANYSSSVLTANSAAGSSTITLQDANAFGVGDYITIQTTPNIQRKASIVSGSNSFANNGILSKYYTTNGAGYYNYAFPTGSYIGPAYYSVTDTGSHETDEVVQIESISGNSAVVSKRFGKKGEIQQDLGLMDYKTFAETFGVSADYFTGTKRVVLIDSNHKSFNAGTNIVISGSAYTISYITTYLSQSSFIDFRNPTTKWTDYIALDPYMYTGSGYPQTGGSSTSANYIPRYQRYYTLTTASRAGTSSLYVNTASLSTPASPLDTECINFLPIKDYFYDGEIEISGSIVRDFNRTGSADIANYIGIFNGSSPYIRHWANASSTSNPLSTQAYDGSNGLMLTSTDLYSKSKNVGNQSIQYGNRINLQNTASINIYTSDGDLVFTSHTGSNQTVNLKLTWENGIQRHYFQGKMVDEFLNPINQPSMPSLLLHRYSSVFSINIKKRYQLAVIDTTSSFSVRDIVKEGGLFENQTIGKTCNFIANEIDDPMGMRNLLWDYYFNKGNTNILPYCHSHVASISGSIVEGINQSTYTGRSLQLQYSGVPTHFNSATYGKSGTDFHITYDIGTSITFDTIGVGFNYSAQGYENITNNTMSGIRIDVGDDPYTFTTVYAKQNDTRLSTLGNAIRFYTLPSGSVNKRFIRVFSDGGSTNANFNSHTFFGAYCFQSASGYTPNTTNQIKLRSAKNFAVGDVVMFWNKEHQSGKRYNGNMWNNGNPTSNYINYDNITGVPTGVTNDSGTVGGLTDYYTITAKSGDIITLDRTPAYEFLFAGTVVLKVNRGKINFTAGRINRWVIYWVAGYSNFHIQHAQFWATSNGTYPGIQRYAGTSGYGDSIRNAIEDCFVYSPQRQRIALAGSLIRHRNVICSKTQYPAGVVESYYTDRTAISFNTFNLESLTAQIFPVQRFSKTVYNHNVELQSYRNNTLVTAKGITADNLPADNGIRLAGPWYVKNNYWQCYQYDPRVFNYGNNSTRNISNIIVQAYKQMRWENNWIDSCKNTLISSYDGNAHMWGASVPMFIKCKIQNYRDYVNAPTDYVKSATGLNSSQIPFLYSSTIYGFSLLTGMPDNLRIRPDKDMYIRLSTRTSRAAMIFDEGTHYSVWLDEAAGAVFSEIANLLTCNFYVKQTCNVRIQLDLQARTSVTRKHAIDVSQTSAYINQGYEYYGKKLPKVIVVDLENNVVLEQKLISSLDFSDYSINKEFTLQPGSYAILLETGQDFNSTSYGAGAIRIVDYKQPTLNILTSNLNNVDILFNNWDNYKMLNSIENTAVLDLAYTQNVGSTTVLQAAANTSTTTRFNNVRI